MKKILITLILAVLTTAAFAGTPFEDDLKTWDPYVADTKQGFDSIFVNPAGMAGQNSFVASVEGGTFGELEDYRRLEDYYTLYQAFSEGGSGMSASSASDAAGIIKDNLSQSEFDALVAGTPLAGTNVGDLTAADLQGLNATQLDTITTNFDNAESNALASLYDVHIDVAVKAKLGFLIQGIGGGLYYRQSFPFNAGAAGFSMMTSEIGAIGGAGFNLGPFALGASLNYGLLMTYPSMTLDEYQNIGNVPMLYGYAWGVDAGAIWNISDSLSVGVVFNDIIGTTIDNAGTTTMNEFWDGSYTDKVDFDYEFSLDMDIGVTWQPEWRLISPKFSFDYYDLIGLIRDLDEYGDYLEDWQVSRMVVNHLRLGANLKLLEFLTLGAQYYNNFFSLGVGVDILFFEIAAEVVFDDAFLYTDMNEPTQVGANLLLRIKL